MTLKSGDQTGIIRNYYAQAIIVYCGSMVSVPRCRYAAGNMKYGRRGESLGQRPRMRSKCFTSPSEFPGIMANDDITLQLKKGEIHALLGENGAGKSTLMSVLFGLYQPEEGEIRKDGKVVIHQEPQRRQRARHRHGAPALQAGRRASPCSTTSSWASEPTKHGFSSKRQGAQKGRSRCRKNTACRSTPTRTGRGHHRRHAAAHRDPQDALPRQ